MKKLIIGLVIGLMLGLSTNAFAAIGDTISAVFASFNYVVNSKTATLDSPVLVYEGTSYVRTTDIANMLGYDVTYKADSRTIEFNKPDEPVMTLVPLSEQTTEESPTPTSEPTPNVSPVPSPLPTDANGNVIPTPSVEPTTTPTIEPTPTVTPSPTPVPSNVAQCQAIRDNYGHQIAMVGYGGGSEGQKHLAVLNLQNSMSSALSSAGCN